MPYTLMKGLVWVLLAVALGILIGLWLRSIVAKRQIARARNHHVDRAELERLRGRLANLEPVVAERDRLRAELDACLAAGAVGSVAPPAAGAASEVAPVPDPSEGGSGVVSGFAEVPVDVAADVPVDVAVDVPADVPVDVPADRQPTAPVAPDVAAGAAVLGRSIVVDDLKAVEGIGPKIEGLCHGIGIRTWFDLSTTEVSLLRTMLADAGPRFRTHDPSTWPQQAGLLAEGRWEEFRALTEQLQGGRAVD